MIFIIIIPYNNYDASFDRIYMCKLNNNYNNKKRLSGP